MQKSIPLLPLFQKFISDSQKGRRLKPNGEKIKPQSVANYLPVYKMLQDFCKATELDLKLTPISGRNQQELKREAAYWKKIYKQLSDFMYIQKGCHDNYVGMVFKCMKTFFNYLKNQQKLKIGDFYNEFYIRKEEIPIITLLPEQLKYLIHDRAFEVRLSRRLRKTKDMFVFGCTVGLRQSDLLAIRYMDIQKQEGNAYLVNKSIKTGKIVKIRLPEYALDIINRRRKKANPKARIFTSISPSQLNKNIRSMAELAGWTAPIGKFRKRNGKLIELKRPDGRAYRFCDLLSSHTMRRTAVTTMLMAGMTETVVKKISGHSEASRAFYRYVNYVQPYLDQEIERMHRFLEG